MSIIIDLGTDSLAISYLINDKIIIQNKWKSKKYGSNVTQKTAILIDNDGTHNRFGQDAIDAYLEMPGKQDNWMLFSEFVSDLYGMFPLKC